MYLAIAFFLMQISFWISGVTWVALKVLGALLRTNWLLEPLDSKFVGDSSTVRPTARCYERYLPLALACGLPKSWNNAIDDV